MRFSAYMVIKDDAYYVDMALKSILPYIEGIYIQDQGSSDGTVDVIKSCPYQEKIVLEVEEDLRNIPRFHSELYDEVYYRNKALVRAEEIFSTDFICKFDADELVTPLLFKKIANVSGDVRSICVEESRFISKNLVSADNETYGVLRDGRLYCGGHILFWSAGRGIKYVRNPAFSNSFHPILAPDPHPQVWIPGITHIHLHRTFGPKALDFWREGGDEFGNEFPFNARVMAPKWFHARENLGTAVKVDFDWPEYVLEKWQKFGIWE